MLYFWNFSYCNKKFQTEILDQIRPPKPQTVYKEVTPPKYVYEYSRREEPYTRPASAHPYTGYPPVYPVYTQPGPSQGWAPPQQPTTSTRVHYEPRVCADSRRDEEKKIMQDQINDLQSRIDRLLKVS